MQCELPSWSLPYLLRSRQVCQHLVVTLCYSLLDAGNVSFRIHSFTCNKPWQSMPFLMLACQLRMQTAQSQSSLPQPIFSPA